MVEETIGNVGAAPKEVSAAPGTTRPRRWMGYTTWEWTRSSRRRRPATAGCWSQRPGAAYPRASHPGTGCAASCVRSGAGSATRSGWRRWNRCSARSSRAGASGSSCCGAWRKLTACRHLHRPQPAEAVPLWGREAWQGQGHRPRRKQPGLHGTATRGIFRLLTAYTCPPRTRRWPSAGSTCILASQLFLGLQAAPVWKAAYMRPPTIKWFLPQFLDGFL